MNCFRLSPLTRQLIIFLLLLALLWDSRPIVGPDGRILLEFTDFPGGPFGGYMYAGDYIAICETKYNKQTDSPHTAYILQAIPLASATLAKPSKVFQFVNEYIPVGRMTPQAWRLGGGWIFVLRLTPQEYDILQSARKRGNVLDFTKMKKEHALAYLKYHNLPH